MDQKSVIPGVILITLGLVFLVGQRLDVGGEGVIATIGVAFLVAYSLTRQYGFLVPGGIMTGLGIGIIYETRIKGEGAPVLLGLGLGFISIFLIDGARRSSWGWWPLIPGGVLTTIGLMLATDQTGLLGTIGRWWPALLIVSGLYLLLQRRGDQPK